MPFKPKKPGKGIGPVYTPRHSRGFGNSPYDDVKPNPLYSPDEESYTSPEDYDSKSTPFQDDRSRFLGMWKMGHNNAADLNTQVALQGVLGQQSNKQALELSAGQNEQNIGIEQRLGEMRIKDAVAMAEATHPGLVSHAKNMFYSAMGMNPDQANVDATTGTYQATQGLATQSAKQGRAINQATFPGRLGASASTAARQQQEAKTTLAASQSPKGQQANTLGYLGGAMMPAAQANRLMTQELAPGQVSYTDQVASGLLGTSPYHQGATPRQEIHTGPELMPGVPGREHVVNTIDYGKPPGTITQDKLAAAMAPAGVPLGSPASLAPQPPSRPSGPMSKLTTPAEPSLDEEANQMITSRQGDLPTKKNPSGRGTVSDTNPAAKVKELTSLMSKVQEIADNPMQRPGQRQAATKDLETIKSLLSKYYE